VKKLTALAITRLSLSVQTVYHLDCLWLYPCRPKEATEEIFSSSGNSKGSIYLHKPLP